MSRPTDNSGQDAEPESFLAWLPQFGGWAP
jgi:hypothetical protein